MKHGRETVRAGAEKIRVMIVDDHLMVRDGLKVFLSMYDDLEVVGEAGEAAAAQSLIQAAKKETRHWTRCRKP